MLHEYFKTTSRVQKDYLKAGSTFNSIQLRLSSIIAELSLYSTQLNLRLRLALFPVDPTTHPPETVDAETTSKRGSTQK